MIRGEAGHNGDHYLCHSAMRDNNLPQVRCRDKKMNWSDQTSGSDPFITGGDNILNMDIMSGHYDSIRDVCDSCLRQGI